MQIQKAWFSTLNDQTPELSHVDKQTNQPTMVDVSSKVSTQRNAHARCYVELPKIISDLFQEGDIQTKKGPVFSTAIVAGTMAVKNTSNMIPFCHPLPVEKCKITIVPIDDTRLQIDCHVRTTHKTGVEMEALTGCSIAALTVYDMCKAMSHDIVISDCRLVSKTGGKSDYKSK